MRKYYFFSICIVAFFLIQNAFASQIEIANTSSEGSTANFNSFEISETKNIDDGKVIDDLSTITWPFNTGEEGQISNFSENSDAYFSANWVNKGSNLEYKQTRSEDGITYTLFNPYTQTSTASAIDLVSFNIRPKTGLLFVPDSISFNSIRVGTNSGYMDIYWKSTDGTLTSLATGIQPARNGQGSDTRFAYDLTELNVPLSDGECALYIYIYNLGDTKQVGFSNVTINGKTTGEIANIPSYKLNATVTPSGAGTVTTMPVGNEFDEGTEITITAATRNFGYQFKEWQDGNGTLLSSASPYTFTISSDTSIVAIYEEIITYSFNIEILGSKWGEVSLTPEPSEGKYEVGTSVVVEVVPNPVTTFSFWDDNTTETTRTILVDENKSFSATFDERPFITGWDFNLRTPNSSRGGDYYSETSNTGLLVVQNQEGTTSSWLAHPGAFNPNVPCSYLWTPEASFASERRHWVASFSTVGYNNIEVKSQMAGSYQHYLTQKMQCSIDGNEYTDLISTELSSSVWTDLNATLPEEFEGQEKIYIRWIADETSELINAGSGNDGTAITNIFVFADQAPLNDSIPPVLVASIPAEDATNATANGSIVLTFNERIKKGSGDCLLGSATLEPTFGSKTVTFNYNRLDYNTSYTFTVPEGALTDMADNVFEGITINFKTLDRPTPSAKLFDAIVAQDGTGDYSSVVKAIEAAPRNSALPYLIFIKNGVYSGHIDIPSNKPFIHLIGQKRDSVIISDARLAGASSQYPDSTVHHVSTAATMVVNSSNCYFENFTIENKFGYDNVSGPQALALYTLGDKIILKNCWLRSYQDTYLTTYSNLDYRHYLQNCRIEGAVDFIYGGGDVFFDQDTIYCTRQSGGYIVAPSHEEGTKWGYVFSNCVIDGNDGVTTYFGRPWHNAPKTSFFNTTCKVDIYPVGWYYTMGAIPAIFADYNSMDVDGNPLDLSQRIDSYEYDNNGTKVTGKAKNSFTDEEAAAYTYENVTAGNDGWDPRFKTESTIAPVITTISNKVTWSAVDYAICYIITRNSKVIGFTTETDYIDETALKGNKYNYSVQAVSEYGTLSTYSNKALSDGTILSVANIEKLEPQINISNSTLQIQNIISGSTIKLFSLNGHVLFTDKTEGNTYSKAIYLRKGIYILTINNESFKIAF